MSFISYSQNNEDVLLFRALKNIKKGFYIDVGASDAINDSVTKAFYDRGWVGINIEPVKSTYEGLCAQRPNDINLNISITDNLNSLRLYDTNTRGWSTADTDVANYLIAKGEPGAFVDSPCFTLNEVFENYVKNEVHFLKVDVEGCERSVLASNDFSKNRPWILVIESLAPHTNQDVHDTWESLIVDNNYVFACFDGLNRYYVATEKQQLLEYFLTPVNVLDNYISHVVVRLTNELEAASASKNALVELEVKSRSKESELNGIISNLAGNFLDQEKLLKDEILALEMRCSEQDVQSIEASKAIKALEEKVEEYDDRYSKIKRQLNSTENTNKEIIWKVSSFLEVDEIQINSNVDLIEDLLSKKKKFYEGIETLASSREWLIESLSSQLKIAQRLTEKNVLKIQRTNDEINAIYKSYSWKLTYPLRYFNNQRVLLKKYGLKKRALAFFYKFKPVVLLLSAKIKSTLVKKRSNKPLILRAWGRISGRPNLIKVFVYVDFTVFTEVRTGVQRVVRNLSASLLEKLADVYFVKWDSNNKSLVLISEHERATLNSSFYEASEIDSNSNLYATDQTVENIGFGDGDWLIVPEVTHMGRQGTPVTLELIKYSKQNKVKTGFIFYDAIPLRRRELSPIAGEHSDYMQHLMLADLVIPISFYSQRDILSYFHFYQKNSAAAPKVITMYLPGESHLTGVKNIEALNNDTLIEGDYILSVGTIVPHKNQELMIRGFLAHLEKKPDSKLNLILVGNLHADMRYLFEISSRVRYLNVVNDDVLVDLYKSCLFTVFPSVLEGFGLPILESLWFGKPCVCANFGAMAEVAEGGGCHTIDTTNSLSFEDTFNYLNENRKVLSNLEIQAKNRKLSRWPDYVDLLIENMRDFNLQAVSLGKMYYFVDQTVVYPANTGIQRVVRSLAAALFSCGANLIPAKWSSIRHELLPVSSSELEHLYLWNGPDEALWSDWEEPRNLPKNTWLIVPELTHFQTNDIRDYAVRNSLRTAYIFYDSIPWKMKDLYPEAISTAHYKYMLGLSESEKVFSISNYSREELIKIITSSTKRCAQIENKMVGLSLPGEFLEAARAFEIKKRDDRSKLKILCVCTVEPRKNHLTLLESIKKVRMPVELVIVGNAPYPELADEVESIIAKMPNVIWHKKVDDRELKRFYSESDITVYPSIEEGFGLPIVESLWNARPCICSMHGAMAEVGQDGGCLLVDVKSSKEIARAIDTLASNNSLLSRLCGEAVSREFHTWNDYAESFIQELSFERKLPKEKICASQMLTERDFKAEFLNLPERPLLSVCISTYNRASWLDVSLKNIKRILGEVSSEVEVLVCDNASTDSTTEVVRKYSEWECFRSVRNSENVGMLGNLSVTANAARGEYIWILGDDDLIFDHAITSILEQIKRNRGLSLIYLNYSYTREEDPGKVEDIRSFFDSSVPISMPSETEISNVRGICGKSENFFTAIYCLVFRRDHAINAYSQDTSGRPFSTMKNCIPTTHYVLNNMMDEAACWIGDPLLVVNLNVSWMKYAALWILERFPEVFDVAEKYGVDRGEIDVWRKNHVKSIGHYFNEIFKSDPENNAEYINFTNLFNSFKHINEFKAETKAMKGVYETEYKNKNPLAKLPPEILFGGFA